MTRGKLLGAVLVAAAPTGLIFAGCSSPEPLAGQGSSCLVTADCQQGLFCVQQKSGAGQCTNVFDAIVNVEPIPGQDAAAASPDGGSATDGAGTTDGTGTAVTDGGGATTRDGGGAAEPETSTGGGPPETGSPTVDASAPVEAGESKDSGPSQETSVVKEAAAPEASTSDTGSDARSEVDATVDAPPSD